MIGLISAARLHHSIWRKIAFPFFGITIVLLFLVLHPAAGHSAGGSSRWIALGPVTIQPSEIAKLSVVAFAAAVYTITSRATLDVTAGLAYCRHAHYLWARSVVDGCSAIPTPQYCPSSLVRRDQMAKFLVNAFAMKLYRP